MTTTAGVYEPRWQCRLNLHQGLWARPYLVHATSTTIIGGDFPRESTDTITEEQRQDRCCQFCGYVSTRRLR